MCVCVCLCVFVCVCVCVCVFVCRLVVVTGMIGMIETLIIPVYSRHHPSDWDDGRFWGVFYFLFFCVFFRFVILLIILENIPASSHLHPG